MQTWSHLFEKEFSDDKFQYGSLLNSNQVVIFLVRMLKSRKALTSKF